MGFISRVLLLSWPLASAARAPLVGLTLFNVGIVVLAAVAGVASIEVAVAADVADVAAAAAVAAAMLPALSVAMRLVDLRALATVATAVGFSLVAGFESALVSLVLLDLRLPVAAGSPPLSLTAVLLAILAADGPSTTSRLTAADPVLVLPLLLALLCFLVGCSEAVNLLLLAELPMWLLLMLLLLLALLFWRFLPTVAATSFCC